MDLTTVDPMQLIPPRSPSLHAAGNKAREAAQEFEAVFLSEMLAPMFENLGEDGLFGGGSGERIYRSMLVQEYAKALSRKGGVGIADAVEREILKLQEVNQ